MFDHEAINHGGQIHEIDLRLNADFCQLGLHQRRDIGQGAVVIAHQNSEL